MDDKHRLHAAAVGLIVSALWAGFAMVAFIFGEPPPGRRKVIRAALDALGLHAIPFLNSTPRHDRSGGQPCRRQPRKSRIATERPLQAKHPNDSQKHQLFMSCRRFCFAKFAISFSPYFEAIEFSASCG